MEYQTFVGSPGELALGKEIELIIRDLTPGSKKYKGHRVRAIVMDKPSPESDTLWLRHRTGVKHAMPFFIKIIQELPLVK